MLLPGQPVEIHFAAVRPDQGEHGVDGRSLSRTVPADESRDFPGFQRKGYRFQLKLRIVLAKPPDGQGSVHVIFHF